MFELRKTFICGAVAALAAFVLAGSGTPALTAEVDAEFKGHCANSLSRGFVFKTPCTITWTAEDGKMYCFGSEGAKAAFLKDPEQTLAKATEFYQNTFKTE